MKRKKNTKWVTLGSFGVDSGQVMIADPCYMKNFVNNEFTATKEKPIKRTKEFSYDGACRETISEDKGGELENGMAVVSSAGFGDGKYTVKALISDEGQWGKRVKELRVIFFK